MQQMIFQQRKLLHGRNIIITALIFYKKAFLKLITYSFDCSVSYLCFFEFQKLL